MSSLPSSIYPLTTASLELSLEPVLASRTREILQIKKQQHNTPQYNTSILFSNPSIYIDRIRSFFAFTLPLHVAHMCTTFNFIRGYHDGRFAAVSMVVSTAVSKCGESTEKYAKPFHTVISPVPARF
ncbi:hypothetical protein K439DRAFT_1628189 [Ramaria rubella]|nr:hypothetical protein K439DRAFT_1628189 [Ramaria rubella]